MGAHGRRVRGSGGRHRPPRVPQRLRRGDRRVQGPRRRLGLRDRVLRRRLPRPQGPREGAAGLHGGGLRHRARGPLLRQPPGARGVRLPEDGVRARVHLVQRGRGVRQAPELRAVERHRQRYPPALDIGAPPPGAPRAQGGGAPPHKGGLRCAVPRGPGGGRRRPQGGTPGTDVRVGPGGAQEGRVSATASCCAACSARGLRPQATPGRSARRLSSAVWRRSPKAPKAPSPAGP